MKTFGSILDFTNARNADLIRAYREQLAKSKFVVATELFARVANSPSVRFWISEERATVVISAMLAGKQFPRMRPPKKEMFDEIFRRFILLRENKPDKSIQEIVAEVIEQPAPKFYLTPRTAGELIYRIKNGWYQRRYAKTNRTD